MIKLEVQHGKHVQKSGKKIQPKKDNKNDNETKNTDPIKQNNKKQVKDNKKNEKPQKKQANAQKNNNKQLKGSQSLHIPGTDIRSRQDRQFETIEKIKRQQNKAKLTIQDLIKQYKHASDDFFTNHGHNPEKQAKIQQHLQKLQKDKQKRSSRLQKIFSRQHQRKKSNQAKLHQRQQKRIQRLHNKHKKRAEKKIKQIELNSNERLEAQAKFQEFYLNQYKKREPKFVQMQKDLKRKQTNQENERKMKVEMIHQKFKPMNHQQLQQFQEKYQQKKWQSFQQAQSKRQLQNLVLSEKNSRLKYYKGIAHKNNLKERKEHIQKKLQPATVLQKRNQYGTIVKADYMPKHFKKNHSYSRISKVLSEDLAYETQKRTQDKKQKKVVRERYKQGKSLGLQLQLIKMPLSHQKKKQMGRQYLDYLASLPKKQKQQEQKIEENKPISRENKKKQNHIIPMQPDKNPYYKDIIPKAHQNKSLNNKQQLVYFLSKVHKNNRSIDLQEKVIKHGSYDEVLDLQQRKNVVTKNMLKNISAKLDILNMI